MNDSGLSFSVIIPVYNGERFIQLAIESCLQQTVLPDEIIVIDDKSTDQTAAMVAGIPSDRIVYIKNAENKGPAFSRNIGMQAAKSSWFFFLDADDTFHPKKIEVIRSCLMRNSTIKAIGHAFLMPNQPLFEVPLYPELKPVMLTTSQVLVSSKIVTPALAVAAENKLLFNEKMKYAEDHDFILRTTEEYGVWFLDMPLCSLGRIPLTEGGITNNRWKMRKGEINMYIGYCKRKGITFAIPFFILFSLFKHVKNALFYRPGN
jgi:glycosyltransferase involved in cell wall biosynthesis